METENRRAITEIQKMMEKNDSTEDGLATILRNIENAAGKAPENVRLREEAAARYTEKIIKRRILKKQARKARAEHHVRCCLEPGRKQVQRKPITELFVNGQLTEDREEWQKELQWHCEEVYTDLEETKEEQESRIEYFRKKKGNQQFTEEGRNAEITVEVLQARAKLSDDQVNGPEDAIVSEMIKKLPMEKIYIIAMCFQARFMGQMESPSSWKVLKKGLPEKTGRSSQERNQKLPSNSLDIGDVPVVCKLYPIAPWEGKKNLKTWRACIWVEWTG